jgi:hypothetical protein
MADGCKCNIFGASHLNLVPYSTAKGIANPTLHSAVNQSRSMRILEIMNDFRTLQHHISSHVTRAQSNPPDQTSYYHAGYVVIRQCKAEAEAILAGIYNPGDLQTDSAGDGEVQKTTLQRSVIQTAHATAPSRHHLGNNIDEQPRIILDASTRRFQAHKVYLRAAAATRWIQMRQQVLRGEKPNGRHANALRAIDQRLHDVSDLPSHCGVPLRTCDVCAGIKNSKDRQGYMWLMNVTVAGAFSYHG